MPPSIASEGGSDGRTKSRERGDPTADVGTKARERGDPTAPALLLPGPGPIAPATSAAAAASAVRRGGAADALRAPVGTEPEPSTGGGRRSDSSGAGPARDPVHRAPLRRLGSYQCLAAIGQGGMAEVFLARHEGKMGFEKLVVLKCIHPHLAKQKYFVDMFLDEARLAARINDPHVVQIYELGEADGVLFIAMEYLAGESLRAVLKGSAQRNRLVDPRLAARIVADAAAGLHAAHELRDTAGEPLDVVHRDASPGNIIVLYNGGVKVVDFGVAKARGKVAQTTGGEVKGKFAYMSPEQLLGEEVDRRADVFSLGVVLWEALTVKRLFRAENDGATVKLILEGTAPPPSAMRADVPPELDRITLRALAKDRQDRYQTAEALRAALEGYLHGTGGPSGPLELAAYMRDLFPERVRARTNLLESAARPEAGAVAPEDLDLDAELDSQDSSSVSIAVEDRATMREIHHALLRGQRAQRRKRLLITAAVALLFAVVLSGVAVKVWRSDTSRPAVVLNAPGATKGKARIDVTPADARVSLDGEAVAGAPPLLLEALAPGTHELTVTAPGFVAATVTFEAKAGETAAVSAALKALAPATLVVTTTPKGATVTLDGVAVGITPFTMAGVRPDVKHALRVTRDGYAPVSEEFTPAPGEKVTRESKLEPLRGAVVVDKRPTGRLFLSTTPWSVVYHGKKKLGETPLLGVRLPAGKVTLRAENPKTGKKKTFVVDIPVSGDARVSLTL
ncbi:MAG TPA: PEGA domain-containing protein [Myxococcota bacterium]|nr:PEGA domain-containing protein [Myxococcota bacterium]